MHTLPVFNAITPVQSTIATMAAISVRRVLACTNVNPVNIANRDILTWKKQAEALNKRAEAFSHRGTDFIGRVWDVRENALLRALRLAFSNHHGIALSPDVIYNIVLQGISIHVSRQPEKYRSLLVSFGSGKQTLTTENNQLVKGDWNNYWGASIKDLVRQIVEKAPQDSILPLAAKTRFSTTTDVEAVAHAAALMDVTSAFYDYEVRTKCGIPFVDLLGQREDWELLASNLKLILDRPELGLQTWLRKLLDIVSNFIAAYDEDDEAVYVCAHQTSTWWKSIYKYHLEGSGGDVMISGWIGQLFPYIYCNYRFPVGITSTDFVWKLYNDQKAYTMKLMAGLVGVTAGKESNVLQPVVGWLVADATPDDDIKRSRLISS